MENEGILDASEGVARNPERFWVRECFRSHTRSNSHKLLISHPKQTRTRTNSPLRRVIRISSSIQIPSALRGNARQKSCIVPSFPCSLIVPRTMEGGDREGKVEVDFKKDLMAISLGPQIAHCAGALELWFWTHRFIVRVIPFFVPLYERRLLN